jgi:hypothetical protein
VTVLRVYDPSECDSAGVPLDWERCRACEGDGQQDGATTSKRMFRCSACDGHGSLRAAAMHEALRDQRDEELHLIDFYVPDVPDALPDDRQAAIDQTAAAIRDVTAAGREAARRAAAQPRCEDCGHPAGEGEWEYGTWLWAGQVPGVTSVAPEGDARRAAWKQRSALLSLRDGQEPLRRLRYEPDQTLDVHWSPCDPRCLHGPPFRLRVADVEEPQVVVEADEPAGRWAANVDPRFGPVMASWRQVDVRTLGWPHDLRPERLAVLCLRCWAARS